jgi:hypothetical protein
LPGGFFALERGEATVILAFACEYVRTELLGASGKWYFATGATYEAFFACPSSSFLERPALLATVARRDPFGSSQPIKDIVHGNDGFEAVN